MTSTEVQTTISEVQAISDSILKTIEATDPGVALPAGTAQAIVDLFAELANKALTAWSASAGTPITVETLQALLPNPTPLDAPTS